jgi:type VI secretion system secreted protein Hcp
MATNYFLRIDGVQGESQDAKHKGEIQIFSWSWAESNPGAAANGGGTGKPNVSTLNVMTRLSKASPALMQACHAGQRFMTAVLTGAQSSDTAEFDFLTFTLNDVTVESIQESASSEQPSESISLAFASFQMQYRQAKSNGAGGGVTKAGWDLSRNTAA